MNNKPDILQLRILVSYLLEGYNRVAVDMEENSIHVCPTHGSVVGLQNLFNKLNGHTGEHTKCKIFGKDNPYGQVVVCLKDKPFPEWLKAYPEYAEENL